MRGGQQQGTLEGRLNTFFFFTKDFFHLTQLLLWCELSGVLELGIYIYICGQTALSSKIRCIYTVYIPNSKVYIKKYIYIHKFPDGQFSR